MQLIVDSGSTKTAWCLTGGSRDDYYTTNCCDNTHNNDYGN